MNKNRHIFCLNCNKSNHQISQCPDPIVSYGIVLVNFNNTIIDNNKQYNISQYKPLDGFYAEEFKNLKNISLVVNNIKFLMVSRKHSLGLSDFIRGKYNKDNDNNIENLFLQMLPQENDIIRYTLKYKNQFDVLWNFFWGRSDLIDLNDLGNKNPVIDEILYDIGEINIVNKKSYLDAKEKFNRLKYNTKLEKFINNKKTLFEIPEFGFPKGRKKNRESDLCCAIREFSEETKIDENDIKILPNVVPIEENLIGTDGIRYKHIYYLAELKNNNCDDISKSFDNFSDNEIGNIGFFNYNDASKLIRDYHYEKKEIIKNIVNLYVNILYDTNINQSWVSLEQKFD